MESVGHSKFDEVWLQLVSQALTKQADLHGVEFRLPSLLDLCPTLPFPRSSIERSMQLGVSSCFPFGSTIETAVRDADSTRVLEVVEGGARIFIFPVADGRLNIAVELTYTELAVLPPLILAVGQIALSCLAYTAARPGWAKVFVGSLLRRDASQKLMGYLVDFSPQKLGPVVRRSRNTRLTHLDASAGKDLVVEYQNLGAFAWLEKQGFDVGPPKGQYLFHNTLAHNAAACSGAFAGSMPVHEDAALAALMSRVTSAQT